MQNSLNNKKIAQCFRKKQLKEFWNFIKKRQDIWYKRTVLQDEAPWTDDKILRNHRFTNVYRKLDPGTQYSIQKILLSGNKDEEKIFNVMIYRLIGRKNTHQKLCFPSINNFSKKKFLKNIEKIRNEGKPVFTGAYMVSGYQNYEGSNKHEKIANLLKKISNEYKKNIGKLQNASNFREGYKIINEIPGFGRFLSYQVLVDLTYNLGSQPKIINFNQNKWVKAGPGAEKGLEILTKNSDFRRENKIIKYLYRNQEKYFDEYQLDFKFLKNYQDKKKKLSLPDIQNCLCEYYKYYKIKNDKGRARRKFKLEEARKNTELKQIFEKAPEIKPEVVYRKFNF